MSERIATGSGLDTTTLDKIDSRAIELVGIVHGDGGPADVARLVRGLTTEQLIGLAISCAAMVDVDKSMGQLLAWMTPDDPTEGWAEDELRKAHAQHTRGIRTPNVALGERIYQRMRKRNRAREARVA